MTDERVIHKLIDEIHEALGCPPSRAASVFDRLEVIRRAVQEFSLWLAAIKRPGGQTVATMPRADVVEWVGERHANEAMGNIRGILGMAGFSYDEQSDVIDIAAEYMSNWREIMNKRGEECMREEAMWHQVEEILIRRNDG